MKMNNSEDYKQSFTKDLIAFTIFAVIVGALVLPIVIIVWFIIKIVDSFGAVKIKIGKGGEINETE